MKLSVLTLTSLLVTATAVHAADRPAADNTDRNDRDRSGATLTPTDQSNSKTDIDMAAAIRRSITNEDQTSVMGKNCKVIVTNGKVTLRGPVENAAEKTRIANAARAVPGVVAVDNQLEIKR